MHINDERQRRLAADGYTDTRSWLLVATGEQTGQVNDLWDLFLAQRGFDNRRDYFKSVVASNSNHISDLQLAFWSEVAPMPGPLP
jgi:hypothetical protein